MSIFRENTPHTLIATGYDNIFRIVNLNML